MRRVVITGLGLIPPIGSGWRTFWEALLEGRSGIGPVTYFDTSELPVHIGAEVKGFSPEPYVRRQPVENLGRSSQLAVAAARMGLEGSRVGLASLGRGRGGGA